GSFGKVLQMSLFNKRKPLVGLDIGSSSVKAVELSRSKKGYQLTGFAWESLNPDIVVDGAIMDAPAMAASIRETLAAGKFKAKRDKIHNHTNVIGLAGRRPEVVDIDAFALQNAFEANYSVDENATVALLNIGASLMNINITKRGMPLFIRDVPVGGNQYTDIL